MGAGKLSPINKRRWQENSVASPGVPVEDVIGSMVSRIAARPLLLSFNRPLRQKNQIFSTLRLWSIYIPIVEGCVAEKTGSDRLFCYIFISILEGVRFRTLMNVAGH
jgi:hypothetical protein